MNLPRFKPDAGPEEFEKLLEQARKASDLMKALSHECRLLILCLLPARGSRRSCRCPTTASR